MTLTLQLFKNSIDTLGQRRLNLHSLSVSELLEYRQGSKFPLFRYSEYTKMPDGIVNFMITVFRLYSRKNCGTKYRQARVFLFCIIYHFIPDFEPLFHFVAKSFSLAVLAYSNFFAAILLSISSHFSTRGSQVHCELANYVSMFGNWVRTSQQSSQVHFSVWTLFFINNLFITVQSNALYIFCYSIIQFTLGVSRMISRKSEH
jgi:hypothetical protein